MVDNIVSVDIEAIRARVMRDDSSAAYPCCGRSCGRDRRILLALVDLARQEIEQLKTEIASVRAEQSREIERLTSLLRMSWPGGGEAVRGGR